MDRRAFLCSAGLAAIADVPAAAALSTQPAAAPWPGAGMHAQEGQRIALAGDRALTIKVDSLTTPGARMSMITEDLPLGAEIRVHRHEREDELIVIRTGQGVATLGDREIPVTVGATVYVPKGVWHGLRNTRDSTSA